MSKLGALCLDSLPTVLRRGLARGYIYLAISGVIAAHLDILKVDLPGSGPDKSGAMTAQASVIEYSLGIAGGIMQPA